MPLITPQPRPTCRLHVNRPAMRRHPLAAAVTLALSLSIANVQAANIWVDSTSDSATGVCRLRDAIVAANTEAPVEGCAAGAGADTIRLIDIAGGTITLSGSRLPTVTSEVTIQGESVTIDGGGSSGLMAVNGASASLSISYLSLVNGYASGTVAPENSGGAINVQNGATLELTGSTLSGNTATQYGGGIALNTRGKLTLTNSTLSGNSAGSNGGGVHAVTSATATLINSTLSGNISAANGGGLYATSDARLYLTNATLLDNTATTEGGGVFATYFGGIVLTNSVIANSTGADCEVVIAESYGVNLIEDGSCLPAGSDRLIGDPYLGPLQDNGGPTMTHATEAGSQLIDASTNDCFFFVGGVNDPVLASDQRGFQRTDGKCDPGAFEFDGAARQQGPDFEVNSNADPFVRILGDPGPPPEPNTLLPNGDGFCNVSPGDCTLREAVTAANTSADASIISFANALTTPPVTVTLAGTQLPTVTSDITIQGAGLSVKGLISAPSVYRSRIFEVEAASLVINNLNLIYGHASTGGAIQLHNGAMLELSNSSLASNAATYSGGGIYAGPGTMVTLNDSTLTGNAVTSVISDCKLNYPCGGGAMTVVSGTTDIANSSLTGNATSSRYADGGAIRADGGVFSISSSTISENYAGRAGGGIWVSGTSFTLVNSTLSGNNSGYSTSGAIYAGPGSDGQLIQSTISDSPVIGISSKDATIDLANSIIANSNYFDCTSLGGLITISGVNLIEDGGFGCGLTTGPTLLKGDPLLGPLADNGGFTLTHRLLTGSKAIDAGDNSVIPAGLLFDQRGPGFERILETSVDLGSMEFLGYFFGDGFEEPDPPPP